MQHGKSEILEKAKSLVGQIMGKLTRNPQDIRGDELVVCIDNQRQILEKQQLSVQQVRQQLTEFANALLGD
jgi:hypothetical protein